MAVGPEAPRDPEDEGRTFESAATTAPRGEALEAAAGHEGEGGGSTTEASIETTLNILLEQSRV